MVVSSSCSSSYLLLLLLPQVKTAEYVPEEAGLEELEGEVVPRALALAHRHLHTARRCPHTSAAEIRK